jgi:hypothetical protein
MALTSPRAQLTGFPTPPETHTDLWLWCREIAHSVKLAMRGKINVNTTFTLSAGATTSTLSDNRIGGNTIVHCTPTTANGAAAMTNLYQTYPNTTEGAAVFTHSNTADVDKTFAVSFLG